MTNFLGMIFVVMLLAGFIRLPFMRQPPTHKHKRHHHH